MEETTKQEEAMPSEATTAEEFLGPPKSDLLSVGMASIGALIAGLVGGLLIFLSAYLLLGGSTFTIGASPIILSMITFFCITIGTLVLYFITSLVFPGRYRNSRAILEQIMIFMIILFIIFTPVYLIVGNDDTTNTMMLIIFSLNVLIATLANGTIMSILSSYRYSLLGMYGSFVGFLLTGLLSIFFYTWLSASMNTLYLLIGLMMVAFFFTTFFRLVFELAYYMIYTKTGSDTLGNIFTRIQTEEREREKEAEKKLTRF